MPFTNCINASPLIAPPAPIALVSRLVMSFTPRAAEDFICPQRVGHLAFSDSSGRETRRRQAAESKKAAETGSPATLMCWGKKKRRKRKKNRARTTLRDRKGASGKRVEERRRGRRLKDRTLSTKEGRESLNRDSDRKDAHGRDWRCLARALILMPETGMTLPLCISLM